MKKRLTFFLILIFLFAVSACKKQVTAIVDVALTENPGDKHYIKGGLVKRGEYMNVLEEKDVDGAKYYLVQIKDVSTKGWLLQKWVHEGELKEVSIVRDTDLLMRPGENSPKFNFQAKAGLTVFQISTKGDYVEIQFPALGKSTAFVKKDAIGNASEITRSLTLPGLGKATVSATSQYKRTDGTESEFDPRNLFDGSLQTAWCEGANGTGEGEAITLFFQAPVTIRKIEVVNGWTKSENLYTMNGRIAKLRARSDYDGDVTLDLQDNNYDYQSTDVMISGSRITFTVDSTHKGRDPDTCMAEIRLTGNQGVEEMDYH